MRYLLLLSILVARPLSALAADDDHDDHADGHSWSWAGVFSLSADSTYTWSCARGSDGTYAAKEVQLLILPAESADQDGLENVEEAAETLWGNTSASEVTTGGVVPIGAWAHLELDQESWMSQFRIRPGSAGAYVVFADHPPTEFENGFHYFKDRQGNDVEPVVVEAEDHEDDHGDHGDHEDPSAAATSGADAHDRMGEVVAASITTALPSLLLIACVGPLLHKMQSLDYEPTTLYAFASGALMGVAFFLLFTEGLHLASEGQEEVDGVWTWGVACLSGWLLCVVIHQVCDILFPHTHHTPCIEDAGEARRIEAPSDSPALSAPAECCVHEVPDSPASPTSTTDVHVVLKKRKRVNLAVALPVIFGDFWHNLVDGMILGFSAKSCSDSMTWTIVAVTVLHEVPQEIADFAILLTKANLTWRWAAAVNFLGGLSSVMGAVMAYEMEISVNLQGVALAFGGGVYLYVATTELGPHMLSKASASECLMRLIAFVVGAASIGLVLLGHEHCSAGMEVEGDSHAGH